MIRNNWILQLYYGKFPYKIKIYLPGVNYLRGKPTQSELLRTYLIIKSESERIARGKKGYHSVVENGFLLNFKTIAKLHKKLNLLDPKKYQIRIEYHTLNIYFINKIISKFFLHEFSDVITNYYKPKNKNVLKFIKNIKKNQRCVETFPWGGYHYRMHINFRQMNKLTDIQRRNFKEWVDTINKNNENNQKIKLTSSLTEFLGEKKWDSFPFKWDCISTHLHIKDKEHLVMCYLYLGEAIKSVTEFILYNREKECIKH